MLDESTATATTLAETFCTAEQAARLWTERARRLGFYHTYDAGSVRKAQQQGRLLPYGQIGATNIYTRRSIEEIPIRPWMRLGMGEDMDAICPLCRAHVQASAVAFRTWVWCPECQENKPESWLAYAEQQLRAEGMRTAASNRLASLRRKLHLVEDRLLILTPDEHATLDEDIAIAFSRHDGG